MASVDFATPTKLPENVQDSSFLSADAGTGTTGSSGLILPPVEETLSKMDRMLIDGKIIPYTTVPYVASMFWTDSGGTFYQKWLSERDNTDIVVGPWEMADDDNPIRYKEEMYDKKRVVTFNSPRTLSSITSPAKDPTQVLVGVEETQYYRTEPEDERVIVMTEVKQTNIPFGEAFSVQWRWVATPMLPKQVLVRVGFAVDFYLDVLVADQLRKQQGDFSQARHLHLFRAMKQDIAERQLPLALKDPSWYGAVSVFRLFFPFLASDQRQITTVPRMIAKVLEQLRLIELIPLLSESNNALLKENLKTLKGAQDSLKALYEKEKDWVLNTVPDEEKPQARSGPESSPSKAEQSQDLPPFLQPIANAVGKLHIIDPFEKNSMKHVLSEMDNTVILLPYVDATLEKMQLLASKTIFHCTTQDVLNLMTKSDTAWYKDWLTESDRSEIGTSDWTEVPTKDDFSGENFSHCRNVTCRFDRSIYNKDADPSAAAVPATQKQTQLCRYDNENSAFCWTISTMVEGMAYAGTWRTHVRWVVSQVEEDAVQVKIGYKFETLKPVMVETQLRAKAEKEAQARQSHLLLAFRAALIADIEARNRKNPVVEAVESSVAGAVDQVRRWVRMYPEHMLRDDPNWEPVFKDCRKKLKLLEQVLRHAGSKVNRESVQDEARNIFIELEQIKGVLEGVVASLASPDESEHTLDAASFTPEKAPPPK